MAENEGYKRAKAANQSENMDISVREIPTISEKAGGDSSAGEPNDIFTSSGWGGGSADQPKAHAAVVKTKKMAAPTK